MPFIPKLECEIALAGPEMYGYYDWCFPCEKRTVEEYPYSFDAHYIWKDSDDHGGSADYGDRWFQHDYEKATKAYLYAGIQGNRARRFTKEQCQMMVDYYYDGKYDCVAYGLCCNVSSGYEIALFFLKEKDK